MVLKSVPMLLPLHTVLFIQRGTLFSFILCENSPPLSVRYHNSTPRGTLSVPFFSECMCWNFQKKNRIWSLLTDSNRFEGSSWIYMYILPTRIGRETESDLFIRGGVWGSSTRKFWKFTIKWCILRLLGVIVGHISLWNNSQRVRFALISIMVQKSSKKPERLKSLKEAQPCN